MITKTVRIQVVDEDELYAEIGKRLRAARDRKGWTLAKVGQRVGHTRASINNMELGKQRLPIQVLYNIALALDVSPKSLLP